MAAGIVLASRPEPARADAVGNPSTSVSAEKKSITPIRTLVAAALTGLALAALATRPAHAQQFFRIGTGGTAGTYQAGDKLKDGALDAFFFFVGGAPAGAIAELASAGGGIELVAIDGPQADVIRKADSFFAPDTIPTDTYKGVAGVLTLALGAQWVTSDKADANTVYEITKALYSDAAQKTLAAGHAKGKQITKENAVKGAGIPFHPGAERFYKEVGLLK